MFKPLILFFATIYFGECAYWESWNSDLNGLPCTYPVEGGAYSGRRYYVIRANWGSGLLPGKYAATENKAYVSFYNKEYGVNYFEILCQKYNGELFWENASSGRTAVYGGKSSSGDTLYICRFSQSGLWLNGKLHNNRCFAPYGGKEYESSNWQTLKFN